MNPLYQYLPLPIMIPHESVKVSLFYVLWLALMFGLLTLAKWRQESERLLGVQKALAEAQLAQLQAQLRPHFLFNALNTVSSLMQTDTARADRVLAQLGDLLRVSLMSGRGDSVPLRQEVGVLRKYAEIMEERFDGRAVLHWDVADDALDTPVPAMLLQPLLENAFKHGVECSSKPVHITVRATRANGSLRVEIHNSGSSLKNGTALAPDAQAQVGLRNCRERLRLLYGESAHLVVSDDPADGVLASVTLPCPAA
jgi:sensor histidine kinase YesM